MLLQGYAVLRNVSSVDDERPFKIVRIELTLNSSLPQSMEEHTVVADHPSFNIASYWAHKLRTGEIAEDEVVERIKEAKG